MIERPEPDWKTLYYGLAIRLISAQAAAYKGEDDNVAILLQQAVNVISETQECLEIQIHLDTKQIAPTLEKLRQ